MSYQKNKDYNVASGIDAAKIADGSVSNTEFQRLNGVTGDLQTQIDGKAPTSHTHDSSDINEVAAAATNYYPRKGSGGELEFRSPANVLSDIGAAASSHTHPATDLNMSTSRLLGRTTAGSGAVEEIAVGAGLTLSAGSLTASASAPALDDLTDVAVTTPADKHALMYDGVTDNRWENRALVLADISDAGTAAASATGDFAAASHTHVIADVTDITAAGAALLDDATAADQRTTLGLGTAATTAASAYATAAQGATADSATQPGDLATTLNVSATDVLLGRSSSGAGSVEEVPCTAAGRALLDDVDAAAQRATLGLGTAATSATGDFAASSHTHAQGDITNLTSDLAAKAPLASPALTGTPTAPTAAAATNTTQIATTAFVQQEITGLGGSTFCGAYGYASADQTPSGIEPVELDTEIFDTDGILDVTTNKGRFTIPSGKGGYWAFYWTGVYYVSSGVLRLYKNGSELHGGDTRFAVYPASGTVFVIENVAAGDYLEWYTNTSGNFYGSEAYSGVDEYGYTPKAGCFRIGDAP